MEKQDFINVFIKYIPLESIDYVMDYLWNSGKTFTFKVVRERKTVLGSHQYCFSSRHHTIKINHNLNKYNFLFTLVHELAHMEVRIRYQDKEIKSHGKEWKAIFSNMLSQTYQYYPLEIQDAIKNYQQDISASSCRDDKLYKLLKNYDEKTCLFLSDIPMKAFFKIKNDTHIFQKIDIFRTKYKCMDIKTKKEYRVPGLMEVEIIENV